MALANFNAVAQAAPPTYIGLGNLALNTTFRIVAATKETTTYGETIRTVFDNHTYTFLPKTYTAALDDTALQELSTGRFTLLYKGRQGGDNGPHWLEMSQVRACLFFYCLNYQTKTKIGTSDYYR